MAVNRRQQPSILSWTVHAPPLFMVQAKADTQGMLYINASARGWGAQNGATRQFFLMDELICT